MAYNIMIHKGTGFSPFKLTFGGDVNVPYALATTTSLKYPEMVMLWQERHERYIQKAQVRIKKSKEKYKNIQYPRIIKILREWRIQL